MSAALAPLLLAHLSPEAQATLAEERELEPRLAAFVATARAAWPELEVAATRLFAAVAAALGAPTLAALEDLRAADLWLACAALGGDPRAIRVIDQHLARIAPLLRGVGLAAHELDDVVQQLRARLVLDDGDRRAKLASYAGRGPIEHWLRIVAVRYARDVRAAHERDQLMETFSSAIHACATDDPELDHVRQRYGALFREALAAAIDALEPDDRDLIRRVAAGTSPAALGEALGVHRTTAIRRFERAQGALREGVRTQLVQRLAIDRFAADSVLRLYDSGFQLGLAAMLESR